MSTPTADAATRQTFRSEGQAHAIAQLKEIARTLSGNPDAVDPFMASLSDFCQEIDSLEDPAERLRAKATRTRLIGKIMEMYCLTQRSNTKQMEQDDHEVRRIMEQNQT